MSLMDWIPTALLLTIAMYSVFFYVIYQGTTNLSSRKIDRASSHAGVSRFYISALQRPATTFAFYLCFYEIPLGIFIITGMTISSEASLLLMQYLWFFLILAVGGFIGALGMPKVVSKTGTEQEEAKYWSDVADCKDEIRNARAKGLAAGFSSTSWRPSSKYDIQMIVDEAIQLKLSEKCLDIWLWDVFEEYEKTSTTKASIVRTKQGSIQGYLIARNRLMSREDDIGQCFRASLSRWERRKFQ